VTRYDVEVGVGVKELRFVSDRATHELLVYLDVGPRHNTILHHVVYTAAGRVAGSSAREPYPCKSQVTVENCKDERRE
jgi:hypothetical protein